MPENELNGWDQWAKYVLHELERLDRCNSSTRKEMVTARIEIASLRVKAGIWGMVGAAIPVGIALAIHFLT